MEENQVHIPDEWKSTELGNLIKRISDGGTPSRNISKYFGGNIPWIVIDDIKDEIYSTREYLTELGLKSCSSQYWDENTIILSTGATIGVVGITRVKAATKQGICGIELFNSLDNKYMMYLLKSMRNTFLAYSQGSTIKEIRPSLIQTLKVILPKSKTEQTTIARILSKVDVAIAQTEQLIAKYTRIKTGLMQDLLTKGIDEHGNIRSEQSHEFKDSPLGRIPKEWDFKRLDDCKTKNTSITYGIVQTFEHIEDGVPVLRTIDLKENGINHINQLLRTKQSISEKYKRTLLLENDIVCNVRASVGDFNLVSSEYINCNTTRGVARICPSNEINPRYLVWFLKSYKNEKQMELLIKGTTFIDINIGDLRKIWVLLPKKAEQDAIADKLDKIQSSFKIYDIQLSKLQSLKIGLMQDLLSGKVRVNCLYH